MIAKRIIGKIGRSMADTEYAYEHIPTKTKSEKPNVVYIVLDDLGFAQLGCYGSTIHTPNIDRLAEEGLRYNNFHTTAICSATRASLLTGANHHTVGIGGVAEFMTGCSNGIGYINPEYATLSEVLKEQGYGTYAVGKWHLADVAECTPAGPFEHWPLGKGFDHYYGFLPGQMDQWHPVLIRDNTYVDQPKSVAEGYHLSEDLTDNAIHYVFQQKAVFPEKPFFVYLAYGAMHTPHHAPKEYIDKYKGKFDAGWDVIREQWFQRQKELGVIPQDAELTPRNELVKAWDDLSDAEKKVYARLMEVYAGFLEHTDAQIGRFIDYLREIDELDNTIVVLLSDNGASADAGEHGAFNSFNFKDTVDYALEHLDEIGGEFSYNHYPTGWANVGNTPFPWYKTYTHSGGVKDPLIVRYPKLIHKPGEVRNQYHHVIDITPTILDIIGIEKPQSIKGVSQKPYHGVSMRYSFDAAEDVSSPRTVQYYEMVGNRGIYKDGWRAVTNHRIKNPTDDFYKDVWELYHVDEDYSECHDVADKYPEKLRELQDEWMIQAGKYGVFPQMTGMAMGGQLVKNERFDVYHNIKEPINIVRGLFSDINTQNHVITAKFVRNEKSESGVIFASGNYHGGYSIYIVNNRLKYTYSFYAEEYFFAESEELPLGEVNMKLVFKHHNHQDANVTAFINGKEVFCLHLPKLAPYFDFFSTIGANRYSPVAPQDYASPFEFQGELKEVGLYVEGHLEDPGEEIEKLLLAD